MCESATDLFRALRDIGNRSTLGILSPHKPIISVLKRYIDPVDVLSLRAAYEGYERKYAGGRWHAKLHKQWFHGRARRQHDGIVRVCGQAKRYDLLEMLVNIIPAKELFDWSMLDDEVKKKNVDNVDMLARIMLQHDVRPPHDTAMYWLSMGLTVDMCRCASVRMLLAKHMNKLPICSFDRMDPVVVDLLKEIFMERCLSETYAVAHVGDMRETTNMEKEIVAAMIAPFNNSPPSYATPWNYAANIYPNHNVNPIFPDIPDDLKVPLMSRVYMVV